MGFSGAGRLEWVALPAPRGSSQGSNPGLPHCRQILLPAEPLQPNYLPSMEAGQKRSEKQNFRCVIITVNSFLGIQEHVFQQSEGVNQKKKKERERESFQKKRGSSRRTQTELHTARCTAGPRSRCPKRHTRGRHWREKSTLTAQLCPTLCDPMDHSPSGSLSMRFSRQYAGVVCHFLLQGISLTRGSNPGLLYCRQTLYHFSHQGSPNPVKISGLWIVFGPFGK